MALENLGQTAGELRKLRETIKMNLEETLKEQKERIFDVFSRNWWVSE